jgi:hypothetical protein
VDSVSPHPEKLKKKKTKVYEAMYECINIYWLEALVGGITYSYFVYLTTLSVVHAIFVVSDGRTNNERCPGENVKGSNRILFQGTIQAFGWMDSGKPRRSSVKVVGVPAEI